MSHLLDTLLSFLNLVTDCLVLLRHVVRDDSGDLDNTDDTEEEVTECFLA
jgi:hypothetical protein